MKDANVVLIDRHPGRSAQTIGIARELGTDLTLIHEPSVGVVGTKGDSQCYLGVLAKVDAVHARLKSRIGKGPGQLELRLVQPEYTIATSDGIRNGTREMRYSLIGRELTNDALCEHLSATGLAGTIAIVACDKPPVGTLAALLEHNQPAIIMSDGSIHPGTDPKSGEKIDLVSAYQVAGHPDAEYRHRIACHACPGFGSCGGMFTYNTMQTFIGVVGMQPLHMVAPPSDDPRRLNEFPAELVDLLAKLMEKGLKPRDIVVRNSIRNAVIVAMAIGGSTNVTLHAPEIARAAGYADFWKEIMTPEEFNHLSQHVVPVLTDARPYGKYSMVDIDEVGGVQVIVRELLEAGLLNGDVLTCTGETLARQVERLGAKRADGKVIYPVENAADDEAVHGRDHRDFRRTHGAEAQVVPAVQLDDPLRVLLHLLDIDAGAEAAALAAEQQAVMRGIATHALDDAGELVPARAVECVDGRMIEDDPDVVACLGSNRHVHPPTRSRGGSGPQAA